MGTFIREGGCIGKGIFKENLLEGEGSSLERERNFIREGKFIRGGGDGGIYQSGENLLERFNREEQFICYSEFLEESLLGVF